jgi:PAS domain S-box-containing protein
MLLIDWGSKTRVGAFGCLVTLRQIKVVVDTCASRPGHPPEPYSSGAAAFGMPGAGGQGVGMAGRAANRFESYGIAVVAIAVAVALRLLAEPWLGPRLPYITAFGGVALSMWLGGAGPAVLAAVLGFFAVNALVDGHPGADAGLTAGYAVAAFAYALSSGVIIAFGITARRARRRLENEAVERLSSEERSRQTSRLLETVILASPIAIIVVGYEPPLVRSWNAAAEALFGWRADEVLGKRVPFVPPEREAERSVLRETLLGGDSLPDRRTQRLRKDGSLVDVRLSAAPLRDDAGTIVGVLLMFADATQARREEDALALLRAEQARVRVATEAGGLGVWLWDMASDTVVWENDRPYEILGIPRGSERVNAARFLAEFVHPEDAASFQAALTPMATEAGFTRWQGRILRSSDRALRWVEFTGRMERPDDPASQVVLGTIADITEHKAAEARERDAAIEARAAAEANAKFRAFFDQGSYFAGLMALDGTVIEANHLSLEASGFARAEVVGRKFWDCGWWSPAPELVGMVQEGTREAAAGRTFRRETPYFTADGRERRVELILAPVTDETGRVLFIAPTGIDVTERQRAEAELRRVAAELAEGDRRKTEFIAVLAHELRNPLAPLRNGLHLMRLAPGDAAAADRVRAMMERQLAQLVRLVDDLLDIARISGGKLELQRERAELRGMLQSAVETSLPLIEARRHALSLDLPVEPLWLDADPTRIAQVIANLLNNAARYTPVGGTIDVSARRVGGAVVLAIADNGIGIPNEALGDIFEMFTQVGRHAEREQGGLGIGLALVRRLVELHGGGIEVHSGGPGQGSTVRVRLPLAGDPPVDGERTSDGSAPVPLARKSRRILVVDDNRDAAESLAVILRMSGHRIEVAYDGWQAIEAAHALQPELVFLDIGLPGMSGHDVARELRAAPGLAGTRLVALTGWGAEGDRAMSRAAGFDEHLTKPADPKELQCVVDRLDALEPTL